VGATFGELKAAIADRYVLERELGAGGMATVFLAEGTVKNYVSRIMEKLHANTRIELAILSRKQRRAE